MKLRYGTPEEVGMSSERVRNIAKRAEEWVAQGMTTALVVLAARRGVIVLHEAYGCLTPEPNSPPVQRDTIFLLASITKPITATAVMILVEDGLVGLNRPVREYIPEFVGEGKDAVMVHHLLTHTSGLRSTDLTQFAANKAGIVRTELNDSSFDVDVEEYLRLRYDAPLLMPPAVEMSYCDFNYALLAEIVRRASGKTLAAFVRQRILEPLGMRDTSIGLADLLQPRLVRRPKSSAFAQEIEIWFRSEWGSDGAASTTKDMATFSQMYLNHGKYGDVRILSAASVTEMTRNQIPGIPSVFHGEKFSDAGWGYGWDIHGNKKALRDGSLFSPKAFGHGGAGGCLMWVDPVYQTISIYFSVQLHQGMRISSPMWRADLFNNAVIAAIEEE